MYGQWEQTEASTATQPDRDKEWRRTNQSATGKCIQVISRVNSKLSCVLHAHRGTKLLNDPQNEDSDKSNGAMVRFRRTRVKGAMVFVNA